MSNWGQGVGAQTSVEWSVVKPVTRGQTVPGAVLNPQLSNPPGQTGCQTVPGQTGVEWAVIKLVSEVSGQTGSGGQWSNMSGGCAHTVTVKSAGVKQMSDAARSNGGEVVSGQTAVRWSGVKRVSHSPCWNE